MVNKKISYTEQEINEAFNCYNTYCITNGTSSTIEKFLKYRYRKNFFNISKKYKEFGTSIPIEEYIKYITNNEVPFKKWEDIKTFKNFVLVYTKEEDSSSAIKRSISFLEKNNLSIDTISENRLIMYLETGSVSPWLILKEFPEFFEYVMKETNNNYCKNILSYYFWKNKSKELIQK